MQHWYLAAFFLAVGFAPAWKFYRAAQTGEARVPAGLSKYGVAGIAVATRAGSPGLYNKIKALHLTAVFLCVLFAGIAAWAS